MSFSSSQKRLALLAVMIPVAVGVGVYIFFRTFPFVSPLPRTAGGVSFEELLPPATEFVLSFNPTDADERARFIKLSDVVMQDKKDALLPFIVDQWSKKVGIGLEVTDIVNFLSADTRVLFALAEPKDGYLLFALNDSKTSKSLFKEIQNPADVVIKESDDVYVVTNGKNGNAYMGYFGDCGFFASASKESIDAMLVRYSKHKSFFRAPSLSTNEIFREAVSRFMNPFSGYAYVSHAALTYRAFENGIEAGIISSSKKEFAFTPATLLTRVPGTDPMAIAEWQNLAGTILNKKEFVTAFNSGTGFDFEKEIAPLLGKSASFVLHNIGESIPSLSVFVDINGTTEQAKSFIGKLDDKMKSLVALGNAAFPPFIGKKGDMVFEKRELLPPMLGASIKFNSQLIDPATANIPLLQLMSKPIELSYGISSDNILFISMLPSIEKSFDTRINFATHPFFEFTKNWKVTPGGFALVDLRVVGAYFDKAIAFARVNKKLSEQEEQTAAIIAKYLAPIGGLISVSSGDGENLATKIFIPVGKPASVKNF